jgi:hypothetical protein
MARSGLQSFPPNHPYLHLVNQSAQCLQNLHQCRAVGVTKASEVVRVTLDSQPLKCADGVTTCRHRGKFDEGQQMSIYKVRIMRGGNFNDEAQNVEARTEKEAAEKLYGGLLFKQGQSVQMRVMVQPSGGLGNPTLFYERAR